ncbi:hypothetical protein EDL79_01315 [Ehrlichia ruminantium]|uniref:Uncharacterized protein n=1 Tax=Ehrlichia ruminantium TaxID=779 RepID=A0AAE6UI91_EHRRU|nr:hypothetical protein [Ehrlichia ruminantium]QGR03239.1 hypothetical protein EDL80_01315 [Ehrlichia ruminantium]QGR04164.1 hypothetical protein EDL79_01315 [Ehrlichia ruminantium]
MIHRLRNIFTIPKCVKALQTFKLEKIRNTQYKECSSGHQAWLDFPRSNILVNGKHIDFSNKIEQYLKQHHIKNINNINFREALHKILDTVTLEQSGLKIKPTLKDEIITIAHQACLHGSLYTSVLADMVNDIQNIPSNRHSNLFAVLNNFQTNITILSEDTIDVVYTEDAHIKNTEQEQNLYDGIKARLSFKVSTYVSGIAVYRNPCVSLTLPQTLQRELVRPLPMITSNLWSRIKHCVRKIKDGVLIAGRHAVTLHHIQSTIENTSTIFTNQRGMVCNTVMTFQRLRIMEQETEVNEPQHTPKPHQVLPRSTTYLSEVTGFSAEGQGEGRST